MNIKLWSDPSLRLVYRKSKINFRFYDLLCCHFVNMLILTAFCNKRPTPPYSYGLLLYIIVYFIIFYI